MIENNLKKILTYNESKFIKEWCKGYSVEIKYKSPRKRKLGDYRRLKSHHYITINNNLSESLFFLTLTHEIAHMHAFSKYGNNIKPHGYEWKQCFGNLIKDSIAVYPKELQHILINFSKNPKANFYSYAPLTKYFHKEDNKNVLFLKDMKLGEIFSLEGKIFIRGQKRKIKYLCKHKSTGKSYIIHGMAPVEKIMDYYEE